MPYSEAIGSVLWLVVISRPDAVYAVRTLSQFIQNPGLAHREALKHVISYLGITKNLWLTFGGNIETMVKGYFDSDWASQQHRNLILGFLLHFSHGVMSWSLKKQNVIALSSTETEYIAQTHVVKEAVGYEILSVKCKGRKKKGSPYCVIMKARSC